MYFNTLAMPELEEFGNARRLGYPLNELDPEKETVG
jgi:hypothetical protein